MPAPSQLLRAARPVFRSQFFTAHAQSSRTGFQTKFAGRRWQSTSSPAEPAPASWIKRMWDSPIGLKTVHFWAPVMKWAIVIAGISDFYRPVENLSLTQNGALTATGLIWTRWCLIIKPRNVLLATVNFFLGMVGIVQVSRILYHNHTVKNQTVAEQVEEAKEGVVDAAHDLKGKAVDAVKS